MRVLERGKSGRKRRLYTCYVMSGMHRRREGSAPPGDESMLDDFRKKNGASAAPRENGAGEAAGGEKGLENGVLPEEVTPELLAEVRAERDSYLDLARRERADFDNYRKRMEREMKQLKRESLANFLKDFFGPLDDLDRVLQESVKTHSFDSLATGVRIMEENFWRTLAKAGVKKIDALGKPFDPNLHEAMVTMPSADYPPGTVMEIYDNGYKLDDYILRPARVVVSRAPEA